MVDISGTGVVAPGQHRILKETSETLSQFLEQQFKAAGYRRIHVVEEAPKPDAVEGKLPAVSIYLYQISLDEGVGNFAMSQEVVKGVTPDGQAVEFLRDAPQYIRLDYLLSAFAQTPEDEQLLLGLAVKGIVENPVLTGEQLKGNAFSPEFELPISLSGSLDEGTLARFWGSMNQPVRPALRFWTSVPVYPEKYAEFRRVRERGFIYRPLRGRGNTP